MSIQLAVLVKGHEGNGGINIMSCVPDKTILAQNSSSLTLHFDYDYVCLYRIIILLVFFSLVVREKSNFIFNNKNFLTRIKVVITKLIDFHPQRRRFPIEKTNSMYILYSR